MTTKEAVELRIILEQDMLMLLQRYQDATGLTPSNVSVQTVDVTTIGTEKGVARSITLAGVRVTVEL